jgi:hypothetical protein
VKSVKGGGGKVVGIVFNCRVVDFNDLRQGEMIIVGRTVVGRLS